MIKTIFKSIFASIFISIGTYCLLYNDGSVISAILFSLGLYGICVLDLNLFTGKCGFPDQNKDLDLLIILISNLISGYGIGWVFSYISPIVYQNAITKVNNWNLSWEYLGLSFLCGMVMFIAVLLYKKGIPIGIFLGIPLFILSGFQHSIANVIIMGCARTGNLAIITCIIGNWFGSLFLFLLYKLSKN